MGPAPHRLEGTQTANTVTSFSTHGQWNIIQPLEKKEAHFRTRI